MNPTMLEVLKAVDEEEEYAGEMPDSLLEYVEKNHDSKAIIDLLRRTVGITKRNIRARVLGLYEDKVDYSVPGFHCTGCGKYKASHLYAKDPAIPGLCIDCDKLFGEGGQ